LKQNPSKKPSEQVCTVIVWFI